MQAKRRLLFEETRAVRTGADALDMEWLRRQFVEPFDAAAQAVQRAGFEQDDTVVERSLVCDFGDGSPPVAVPAAWLSDGSRMQAALLARARAVRGASMGLANITIIGLRVEAWHEQAP